VTPSAADPFFEEDRGPDTERMPPTLPGLGPPPERNESDLREPTPEEEWPEEVPTALQVPRAHPQPASAGAARCRCGVHLAQLVGEDPSVWSCASLLLGVASGGLHDERVRHIRPASLPGSERSPA
jgi:hypothetical protein